MYILVHLDFIYWGIQLQSQVFLWEEYKAKFEPGYYYYYYFTLYDIKAFTLYWFRFQSWWNTIWGL